METPLVKGVFGLTSSEHYLFGYWTGGHDGGGLLEIYATQEQLEAWAQKESIEVMFDEGKAYFDNVNGVDVRNQPHTDRVNVEIEAETLDTDDGEQVLYALFDCGWAFTIRGDIPVKTLRKGMFGIDEGEAKVVAYTPTGDRWNGWSKVFAEKDAIEKWLTDTGNKHEFRADGTLFVTLDGAFESDDFMPIECRTEEGIKTLYYISGWCWDEYPLHGYYWQFASNGASGQKFGPYDAPIYIKEDQLRVDGVDCPLAVYMENGQVWCTCDDSGDTVYIWYE